MYLFSLFGKPNKTPSSRLLLRPLTAIIRDRGTILVKWFDFKTIPFNRRWQSIIPWRTLDRNSDELGNG
jgi:hypothetical protein